MNSLKGNESMKIMKLEDIKITKKILGFYSKFRKSTEI